MKLWVRIAIFAVGVAILFFAWHKTHNDMVNLQTPSSGGGIGSAEVLVVVGSFVALMAFAPSQETLGRWMALKKPRKAKAAHFKRRH
jgi:hypothetical protein